MIGEPEEVSRNGWPSSSLPDLRRSTDEPPGQELNGSGIESDLLFSVSQESSDHLKSD